MLKESESIVPSTEKVSQHLKGKSHQVFSTFLFLFLIYTLLWPSDASGLIFLSPYYHLTGTADWDYVSDTLSTNDRRVDMSSFTQNYFLDLNGPIIGPYFGMFTLDTSLGKALTSATGEESSTNHYSLGGAALIFPTGKVPTTMYYDMATTQSESSGIKARNTSDSYGLELSPRFWRGYTSLTYDHSKSEDNVGRSSFSNTSDRASLSYEDLHRFDDSMLQYRYLLNYTDQTAQNLTQSKLANDLGLSYTNSFSNRTVLGNSLFLNYTDWHGTNSGSSSTADINGYLSHTFTPRLNGLLDFNHNTAKPLSEATINTDTASAVADYRNIPNPVPKMDANMRASALWVNDSRVGQSANGGLSLLTMWSYFRAFDVLNNFGYFYTTPLSGQTTTAPGASDNFVYNFELRQSRTTLSWHVDYSYQQAGVFTQSGGGSGQSFALGETLSQRNFANTSDYVFSKTDTNGSSTLQQWIRSTSYYIIDPFLNAQSNFYILDSNVSAEGQNSSSLQEYLDLRMNWRPYERVALSGGGDVAHSSGTGGSGMGWGINGSLAYFFRFFIFNMSYSYQRASSGNSTSNESRLEMRLSTAFDRIL